MRFCFFASICWIFLSTASGQNRVVEVVNPEADSTERAAHHLGMTVEQLEWNRGLLDRSLDLLLEGEADTTWNLAALARTLRMAWPSEEAAPFDRVLGRLQSIAAHTPDPAQYQWASRGASYFLFPSRRSPRQAASRARSWPERPDLGPEAEAARRTLLTRVEERVQFATLQEEGGTTLDFFQLQRRLYGTQGNAHMLDQLMAEGHLAEAYGLATELARELETGDARPGRAWPALARHFPALFHETHARWQQRILESPDPGEDLRLETPRGRVLLNGVEARLLTVLRNLRECPQAAVAAYRRSPPSLQAKIESLGGLDAALLARTERPDQPRRPRRGPLHFRGEASRNPARVRSRLQEMFPEPADLEGLLNSMIHACRDDPAWSRLALEYAVAQARRTEELAARVDHTAQVLQVYGHCEGRLPVLLREEVLDLLEEAAEPESGVSTAHLFDLETAMLYAWSLRDPQDATRYIRLHPDPGFRFKAFLDLADRHLETGSNAHRWFSPRRRRMRSRP